MDVTTLTASFAGVTELVSLMVSERDRQKLATLQSDLTAKIISTQSELTKVLGTIIEQERKIHALEQRNRDLESAAAERGRYKLTKMGEKVEFYAYQLCESTDVIDGSGEVGHFLCQPCFDAGKKAVLVGNGEGYFSCPICRQGAQITRVADDPYSIGGSSGF